MLLVDWFSSAGSDAGLFNSFMFERVGCLLTSVEPCDLQHGDSALC